MDPLDLREEGGGEGDECFLLREREEERREEEKGGERLRERTERRDTGLALEDLRLP